MTDGDREPSLIPQRAGEELRAAREAQGFDLGEVAARTRIPQRHLASIESGDYSALPSTTYATGFARAYARAVGIDDVALIAKVRAELSHSWDRPSQIISYEPDEAARVPSRGIMWLGVLAAVLIVIFAALWFGSGLFRGGGSAPVSMAVPSGDVAAPVAIPTASPAPAPAGGQVTLTATDEVWVRVYDAADTTLLMRTLAAGERYDVPAGADRPMINVGRPDKLQVSVNGSAVAPLGDGRVAIKDLPISAEALLARGTAAPTPSPTPVATTSSPPPRAETPRREASRTDRPRRPAPSPSPTRDTGAPESLLPPGLSTNTAAAR